MLTQQIIAILIISFLSYQVIKQKKKNQIGNNEYMLWLSIWITGAIAIIFLKQIDSFLSLIGLSASAINFLIYLSVIVLFYFVFKMRLTITKLDQNLTKLSRIVALENEKKEDTKETENK